MPIIKVLNDFVLTLDDGAKRTFKQGEHFVEDHIAEHWYVRAHSTPVAAEPADAEPETSPEPTNPAPPFDAEIPLARTPEPPPLPTSEEKAAGPPKTSKNK